MSTLEFRLAFVAQCSKCHSEKLDWLVFDDTMRLVDSDGGLVFHDGWHCHLCLGEPYESSEVPVR